MKRLRTLQGRLLAWVLGLVALLWCLTAVATWLDARHELDELLDSHLAQAAALLVAQQSAPPDGDDDDGPPVDAPLLHRYAQRTAFQVWHEGRLVQRSANAPTQAMAERRARGKAGFETVVIQGEPWRVFAAQGAERDVQVFVGEQLWARNSIVFALLRSTLSPLLLALPLLAAATWWAVRQGTAPLRALGVALGQRRPQDLHALPLQDTPAEVQPLLQALNQLFERIAQLLHNERRFTADAAHELRTPIAALRTQAQVALLASDEATRRQALQSTLLGCDRATRLVEQLLQLARLEATATAPGGVLDLGAVVRRVVADLAPTALARGQRLDIDAEQQCPVRGDDSLLAVLVRNLVDNAARYSPDGATLRVHLRSLPGGRVQLRVEDSGPGLSEADLQRLGERFFRALGHEASGSGLGWSIVQRVAAVLGATVQVQRSAALGGLCVLVDLPGA